MRYNRTIEEALVKLDELSDRYRNVAIADRQEWTNQNLSFTRALGDMIHLAKAIARGALLRNECRGAHFKPDHMIPSPRGGDPQTLRAEATAWCKAFRRQTDEWLRTTIAEYAPDGPKILYEPVDTSLIPPRPRTYGLVGAEIIEEVWREMQKSPRGDLVGAGA